MESGRKGLDETGGSIAAKKAVKIRKLLFTGNN